MDPDRRDDDDTDDKSKPGIPRPGSQEDQQQNPNAPSQPQLRNPTRSNIILPSTGNPDLNPAGLTNPYPIDLRERNPLVPQGMLFDPRQLLDQQRRSSQPHPNLPPGARFDPFGPPDPDLVGPGRGPLPDSTHFANPDPDHFQPPGLPPQNPDRRKGPFPLKNPTRGPFGGPDGPGGPGFGPPFV